MPLRNARLTGHGRRLLVERVRSGRPVAHVAAEMGISRPTAQERTHRPFQPSSQDTAPDGSRHRGACLQAAAGPKAGPGTYRTDPGPARLHRAPHPHPARPEPSGLPGPAHWSAHPPLRARPARRTGPRGHQETRPDPRRRRPQSPGPTGRPGRAKQCGLRLRPLRRRRPQPPRLQRDPPGREGRHVRRIPPPGRGLLPHLRHRARRARRMRTVASAFSMGAVVSRETTAGHWALSASPQVGQGRQSSGSRLV